MLVSRGSRGGPRRRPLGLGRTGAKRGCGFTAETRSQTRMRIHRRDAEPSELHHAPVAKTKTPKNTVLFNSFCSGPTIRRRVKRREDQSRARRSRRLRLGWLRCNQPRKDQRSGFPGLLEPFSSMLPPARTVTRLRFPFTSAFIPCPASLSGRVTWSVHSPGRPGAYQPS